MSDTFVSPYTAVPSGYKVVLPGPNELLIDIDCEEDLVHLGEMLNQVIGGKAECSITKLIPSKTKGHYHAYVNFKLQNRETLTSEVRIALQACLGSDRRRELLSILAVALGVSDTPTVFFEPVDGQIDNSPLSP